uniref:Secreted protein n=1 Tax=Mesocestoides corti TaxID=53468 RepID=A0A5K3EWW4_MESCO
MPSRHWLLVGACAYWLDDSLVPRACDHWCTLIIAVSRVNFASLTTLRRSLMSLF